MINCVDRFLMSLNESEKRVSSKGIIIHNNKILILRIQTGCHAEGVWDLPGGGIEKNENSIDCLKREVKEETNLDLIDSTIKSLNITKDFDIPEDGVHARWKYFRAESTNSNVVLNPAKWLHGTPEHSEFKWLDSLTDLEQIDICPNHRKILRIELKKLLKQSNKF